MTNIQIFVIRYKPNCYFIIFINIIFYFFIIKIFIFFLFYYLSYYIISYLFYRIIFTVSLLELEKITELFIYKHNVLNDTDIA